MLKDDKLVTCNTKRKTSVPSCDRLHRCIDCGAGVSPQRLGRSGAAGGARSGGSAARCPRHAGRGGPDVTGRFLSVDGHTQRADRHASGPRVSNATVTCLSKSKNECPRVCLFCKAPALRCAIFRLRGQLALPYFKRDNWTRRSHCLVVRYLNLTV